MMNSEDLRLELCNCFTLQDRLDRALRQLEEIEDTQDKIIYNLDNLTLKTQTHPIFLFFLFFVAFIAFDFWAETLDIFIREQFHNGKQPSWKAMALYAGVVTIIFIIIILLAGIPLTTFESV